MLPLEEYVANYDSILEDKPFQFGNMKGKVLDKSKFFNDHSDYEVLLRDQIPNKYSSYFYFPNNDSEIELGRSSIKENVNINGTKNNNKKVNSNKLNLSPIKNHSDNINSSIKDSEVLFKKDYSSVPEYLQKDIKSSDTDFSLDLGDLDLPKNHKRYNSNLRKPSNSNSYIKSSNILQKSFDINIDDIDDFCEQTFKILNKNSLEDKDGKELNFMIQTLIENLKDLKSENSLLKSNSQEMKLIVNDLNKLINSYKSKLKSYYLENKTLKSKLNATLQQKLVTDSINTIENIDQSNDTDNLDDIDKQIKKLKEKREKIVQAKSKKPFTDINLSELSDNIVNRLLIQLQNHKNGNHSEASKHALDNDHQDCPFCVKSKENDLFSTLFSNSSCKELGQNQIIELLAERIKMKLNTNTDNKNIPDIW